MKSTVGYLYVLIFWYSLAIFPSIKVEATVCYGKPVNGSLTEYSCVDWQYCCASDECCTSSKFYSLWYFWLAFIVVISVSGVSCLVYRKKYIQQRIVFSHPNGRKTQTIVTVQENSSGGEPWGDAAAFSAPLHQVLDGQGGAHVLPPAQAGSGAEGKGAVKPKKAWKPVSYKLTSDTFRMLSMPPPDDLSNTTYIDLTSDEVSRDMLKTLKMKRLDPNKLIELHSPNASVAAAAAAGTGISNYPPTYDEAIGGLPPREEKMPLSPSQEYPPPPSYHPFPLTDEDVADENDGEIKKNIDHTHLDSGVCYGNMPTIQIFTRTCSRTPAEEVMTLKHIREYGLY